MGHSAEMNYDLSWDGALLPSQVRVLLARTGSPEGDNGACCGGPALSEGHGHWDAGRGGVDLGVGVGGPRLSRLLPHLLHVLAAPHASVQ